MAIIDRNLPNGTILTATYKKQAVQCEVRANHDGRLEYVVSGKSYASPSAAAAAITGGAVNGWKFWTPSGQAPAPITIKRTNPGGNHNVTLDANATISLSVEPVDLALPEGWIMIPADLSIPMRPGYVWPPFQQAMFDNICMDCKGPLRNPETGGFCSTAYPVRAVCSACKLIDLNDVDHEVAVPTGKKKSRKMR